MTGAAVLLQRNQRKGNKKMRHQIEARVDMYEVTADLHSDGSLTDVTFFEYTNDGEMFQVRAIDIDLADHRKLLSKLNDVIFNEELNSKQQDPMTVYHNAKER